MLFRSAQKALGKKTNKTRGTEAKGDRIADQSSMSHASRTVRRLCPDSLEPMLAVRLTQPNGPRATRGHNVHTLSSIEDHRQVCRRKSSRTSGWLVKVIPAFEKVVPCNRPTKKIRSPAKATQENKTTQKATQQMLPVHPMIPWYFIDFEPLYTSEKYYD